MNLSDIELWLSSVINSISYLLHLDEKQTEQLKICLHTSFDDLCYKEKNMPKQISPVDRLPRFYREKLSIILCSLMQKDCKDPKTLTCDKCLRKWIDELYRMIRYDSYEIRLHRKYE